MWVLTTVPKSLIVISGHSNKRRTHIYLLKLAMLGLSNEQLSPDTSRQGASALPNRISTTPRVIGSDKATIVDYVFYGSEVAIQEVKGCLLYTSPSPRDGLLSRMPSSA